MGLGRVGFNLRLGLECGWGLGWVQFEVVAGLRVGVELGVELGWDWVGFEVGVGLRVGVWVWLALGGTPTVPYRYFHLCQLPEVEAFLLKLLFPYKVFNQLKAEQEEVGQ